MTVGGAHMAPLQQQQHSALTQQQQHAMMMAGNPMDVQMAQQQRMWATNGATDAHGRPYYAPMGGQQQGAASWTVV